MPLRSARRSALARFAALQRACALGGVALALLTPFAQAQDAAPAEATPARVRRAGARPAGRLAAPVRRIDAGAPAASAPAARSAGDAALLATPAFGAAQTNPFGLTILGVSGTGYTAPNVADLDGDGDNDVLVGRYNGEFVYFQNTAGPGVNPSLAAAVTNPFGLTSVGNYSAPSVADLDGDGDMDVLSGSQSGTLRYFQNSAGPGATPVFGAQQTAPFGLPTTGLTTNPTPSVADLDGDGDMDILAGRGSGEFQYFQNTAGPGVTPAFAALVLNPFGLTDIGGYSQLSVQDLDGDGDLDVLAGAGNGNFSYFANTAGPRATPTFAAAQTNPFGLADLGSYSAPSVADFDGDGDMDVLSGEIAAGFRYFANSAAPEPITASLTGTDGYRMVAAPSPTTTIGGLLGSTIYTQGFPGATATTGGSTVYRYDETQPGAQSVGYVAPGTLTEAAGIGRGLFVYIFADQDPRPSAPGQQGGFPKTLTATGRRPLVGFRWAATGGDAALTFTDSPATNENDGWNLLGNPFGTAFDWDGTTLANVNAPVYVYDNVTANYRTHTRGIPAAGNLTGGMIAPFQGFWVKANAASPSIRARAATTNGGVFYRGNEASSQTVVGLRLRPGAGSVLPAGVASEAFLALGVEGAAVGADAFDAVALVPPASNYVLLGTSETSRVLAIDARPEEAGAVTVDLDVSAVANAAPVGTALVLDWPALNLPAGWRAELRDAVTGVRVDMAAVAEYAFTLDGPAVRPEGDALTPPALGGAPVTAEALAAGRFTLVVTPRGATAGEAEVPQALTLSAARPNPTTGASSLVLSLPEASDVRVAVYDVLGREVALLVEGAQPAGDVAVRVEAGALAAGTYVVRATVGTQVLAQRLTVTR